MVLTQAHFFLRFPAWAVPLGMHERLFAAGPLAYADKKGLAGGVIRG